MVLIDQPVAGAAMAQPPVLCETKSTYKDIHSDQSGRNDKESVTVVNVDIR